MAPEFVARGIDWDSNYLQNARIEGSARRTQRHSSAEFWRKRRVDGRLEQFLASIIAGAKCSRQKSESPAR